jgi:transposase InsO family protein
MLRIRDLAATRTRYGYFRIYILLRREGWLVNHKRVYQLYRDDGLPPSTDPANGSLGNPRSRKLSDCKPPTIAVQAPQRHSDRPPVATRVAQMRSNVFNWWKAPLSS